MNENNNVYNIIEFANSHGGDFEYLTNLINEFKDLKDGFAVKFQAFAPDKIATKDFEWYKVYQELYFTPEQWKEAIELASASKDVWLDIFDEYGTKILKQNFQHITGIKLQSSVLYNKEVFKELKKFDLGQKKLILNIAARSIADIEDILVTTQRDLNPQEIILEFGFQGYPTQLDDSGLSKIPVLQKNFNNRLVFADHTDAQLDDAIWLPVAACMLGINIIEKHVMLKEGAKYDFYSSLTPDKYKLMIDKIESYHNLKNKEFINNREVAYLQNSIMVPILAKEITQGSLVSLTEDCIYRRSGKPGMNVNQIETALADFNVISRPLSKGEPFNRADFKKANIATIIACRLKSSRLTKKALLKIGELTSVELCIANALKFDNVNHTILATSTTAEDQELKNHTFSPSVIFHTGHPDDVIQRYLDICDSLKIDIVIRVTADMPFVDNEICQILLKEHFKSGADYTTAKHAAVGTNPEIINVAALRKVKKYFPNADYSEYMTWYFQNNPEHFRLNIVDLPEDLIRDYRLTLDYQEDLDLFNKISSFLGDKNYSIRNVFEYLDNNKSLAEINGHIKLKYKTDKDLIKTLNEKTKMR